MMEQAQSVFATIDNIENEEINVEELEKDAGLLGELATLQTGGGASSVPAGAGSWDEQEKIISQRMAEYKEVAKKLEHFVM